MAASPNLQAPAITISEQFEAYEQGFLALLTAQGYASGTLHRKRLAICAFSEWAMKARLKPADLNTSHAGSFAHRSSGGSRDLITKERVTARQFIEYLDGSDGRQLRLQAAETTQADAMLGHYIRHLRNDKGLAENSIAVYRHYIRDFLTEMDGAGTLPPSQWTALTIRDYSTLLGLLASTGLRPGEALALDRADVDLDGAMLTVRQTKFGKSRLVPFDASTCTALSRYAKERNRRCPEPKSDAFLVSERGLRIVGCSARSAFVRLSQRVGLRPRGDRGRDGHGPRLQDFRHTFATRRLIEWYRSGVDVARAMPTLSAYLGHVRISDTYWYLQSVPELLQYATDRAQRKVSSP